MSPPQTAIHGEQPIPHRAHCTVELPGGQRFELFPGDIIGRMGGADLQLRDARVSEAHALLSRRGHRLVLLRLRGPLYKDGKVVSEITLVPGVTVGFAEGLSLRVVSVSLPMAALALKADGDEAIRLTRATYSVFLKPNFTLKARYHPQADAWVWCNDEGYFLEQGGVVEPLVSGQRIQLDGIDIEVTNLSSRGTVATMVTWLAPLKVVAQFDAVHIHRKDQPVLRLGGLPARIISELVSVGVPVEWDVVATEIWGRSVPRNRLRLRWDKNLRTLRMKLQAAGIERPLVTSFGRGLVALNLRDGDEVVDET